MADAEALQARTALILYGSETGNAQEVAEEIGRIAERLHFSTHVAEFDSLALKDLFKYSVVLFAISTTGQGEFPGNARAFWRKLRNARLQPGSLAKLRFASFGLGDSSYPQYNWAHRKLCNRLSHLGAVAFVDRGEADEQHPEGTEGCFLPWSNKLRQALLDFLPLPSGQIPIPDDVFLSPKWTLNFENDRAVSQQSTNGYKRANEDITDSASGLQSGPATNDPSIAGRREITVTLSQNSRLTPPEHWQDVRLFEFLTDPVEYTAGDVLTIIPKNDPADVQALLTLMSWRQIADDHCHFQLTSSASDGAYVPPTPGPSGATTLRQLLTDHLDINSIPRRSFFALIAHFTEDETQKERLLDFTKAEYVDELYDYTSRPRRSIVEVLQEFDTLQVPPKWAASIFPRMRGRQFSIASGGALKTTDAGEGRIQLLVAIVKYRTVIKKIREGICTRYLASLSPGTRIAALLCKGGIKHDMSRPAVMIGPGTGLAPLRSMLYERALESSKLEGAATTSSSILFFGGRNRSADFFFEDEWPSLQDRIALDVQTAFSRDQKSKVYVQDAIRKHSRAVFDAVREGNIYICGSSGKMPQAVREALLDVMEKESKITRSQVEAWFKHMETMGRYQQETW